MEMHPGDVLCLYQDLYPFRLDSYPFPQIAAVAPVVVDRRSYIFDPALFHEHANGYRKHIQMNIKSSQERVNRARESLEHEEDNLRVEENRLLELELDTKLVSCTLSFAAEGCVVCNVVRPRNPVSLLCCRKVLCASCFDQLRYRWLQKEEVDHSQIDNYQLGKFVCKPCPTCRAPVSQIPYNRKYHQRLLSNVDY